MSNGDGDKEQKIKMTKTFSCPHCGSNERLMDSIGNKEKEKGNIPQDTWTPLEMKQQLLMNPKLPPMIGMIRPAGVACFDVCLGCGTYYCYLVAETVGTLAAQPQGMPMPRGGQQMPRF